MACLIHDFQYYTAKCNDDGWMCVICKYKPPQPEQDRLSKENFWLKLFGVIDDLNEHGFIYIPNGSTGEAIMSNVMGACQRAKRYDQLFIVQQTVIDGNIDLKED